jgi:hypothetical protein
MAVKVFYYGQNVGNTVPDVILTGNPALDQPALATAGYLGGRIMAIAASANLPGGVPVIVPCNTDILSIPFGTLLNDPGEFSGSIGPSGSGKAPVVRALWFGAVDSVAFDTTDTYALGGQLFCGGAGHSTTGKYIATVASHGGSNATAKAVVVGLCTSLPGAANFYGPGSYQYGGVNNWLGVASLL